jgi:hypothetical protein
MNEQQLAAVKQALEALEKSLPRLAPYGEQDWLDSCKAITALQSIIAQHALDKKAENARELGLSYDDEPKIGCVNHDCDQCRGVQEPVAQPLDAKENKYFSDGQEYVFESASYYARSRQLARAEQAIVKARIRLEGDCKQSLDKRTMPDWEVVNQLAVESLSYIEQYLKIETYGKSTTKDDLKAMAEINFRPPAPQPVPVKTYHDGKPWPVAPKPWVGLSEDEINKLRHLVDWTAECSYGRFAYELERLLREKNT